MKISPEQIKTLHALLPLEIKNDKEAKQDFIYQFTKDSGKLSTKDLTHAQANEGIIALGGRAHQYDNWAIFSAVNAQHIRLLSVVQEKGWTVWNEKLKRQVADLHRVSEFLKSAKSPVKKPLKEMTKREVSKIIYAFESMTKKEYN